MDDLLLCEKLTAGYDKSHDVSHHLNVLRHTLEILMDSPNRNELYDLVYPAAVLHDTIDHKYCTEEQTIAKQLQLSKHLEKKYPTRYNEIIWIIENISFSKEKKRGYPAVHSSEIVTEALRIVSDADKIEALGITGIQRMLDFNMNQGLNCECRADHTVESMVNRIVEHTAEKLSHLKDHYIHTKKGKELAQPFHDEMMSLVNDDDRLTEFVRADGRFE